MIENIKNLKNIRKKSVLVIETNPYHAETIPGNAKYFLDLGYNVDIFLNDEIISEQPMYRCSEMFNVYTGGLDDLKDFLGERIVNKYDFIFFNSLTYNCSKYAPKILNIKRFPKYGIFGIEHDVLDNAYKNFPELQKMAKNKRLFVLSQIDGVGRMNPHWFGSIKITPKNKKVIFIAIGVINSSVKNHQIIIDSVNEMISKGFKNFKIVVIGRGNLDIPEHLKAYFDVCGRLNFPDMFSQIEKADFLLGLMDINNPQHHRYLHGQASGSVQLSYGFGKPLIINDVFGKHYNFTDEDSVMYSNNNLVAAMISAYKMSMIRYENIQNNLLEKAKNIYEQSLSCLEQSIAVAQKQHKSLYFKIFHMLRNLFD